MDLNRGPSDYKSTVSKWKYKAIEEGEIEESYGNRRWQKGEINDDIPF